MYYWGFREEEVGKMFKLQKVEGGVRVLKEHKEDLKELSMLSIVKFILTEGEKFIIFAFRDFVRNIHNIYRI